MKIPQLKIIVPLLILGSLLGWIVVATYFPGDSTPMSVTRNGVTAGLTKIVYRNGEDVTFWVENNRNGTIYFMVMPPWEIEQKVCGEWKHVYPSAVANSVVEIPPGRDKTWIWHQQTDYWWSSPGDYRVILPVHLSFEGDPEVFYLPFKIRGWIGIRAY
ncbi:MAG: DUF4384 domain-containing protein [Candidatus Korarchaeota archaeon]|nr:DUF4384 domain-containing protein [Candidatus Korarchaeota archaeon]NIU82273.1 hypothetical protein [Candidatus Thorarchaeota archaeon]NIW12727.1 hypothetical protein [Candidatus Thorarchaeota archaeon]NIW50938.1 hypothetical protein [Candidatus Korarchaeota archaeon]